MSEIEPTKKIEFLTSGDGIEWYTTSAETAEDAAVVYMKKSGDSMHKDLRVHVVRPVDHKVFRPGLVAV